MSPTAPAQPFAPPSRKATVIIAPSAQVVRSIVYNEPGRFAGWPANYGMWAFDDGEVVLVFLLGHTGSSDSIHARDTARPFVPVLARSFDVGSTWHLEDFAGAVPGAAVLSGDEHQDASLKAGPRLRDDEFVPLDDPVAFDDPETLVMLARTDLGAGSRSWFYVSRDRGRAWSGPYVLPDFGVPGIAARTDVVPLGPYEALFMLTAAKSDGHEGHVFAAFTADGGHTFTHRGWLGSEPSGLQIMPSSLRTPSGTVLSAVRCHGTKTEGRRFWIDLYASTDTGLTWAHRSIPVVDTGPAGNPPVLLALDDRLLCVYGFRGPGSGLRYVTSDDDGWTWSAPIVLTDDTGTLDMGYPRAVVLPDQSILACYYSNRDATGARSIEAVRWRP